MDYRISNQSPYNISRQAPDLVRRYLGLRHIRVLQSIRRPDSVIIDDLAADAEERGVITTDECYELVLADMVLLDTASTPEPVYVVAEISLTLDDHDIDRAARRARILRAATGNDAHPAVIGTAISDPNRRRAEDNGVTVILVAEQG